MTGTGRTIVAAGGTLTLSGSGGFFFLRMRRTPRSALCPYATLFRSSGTLLNKGVFTASTAATLSSRGYPEPGGSNAFINAGTFTQQGTGTVQFWTYYTGVAFNNSGTVDVEGGTLSLGSGGTNSGSFG